MVQEIGKQGKGVRTCLCMGPHARAHTHADAHTHTQYPMATKLGCLQSSYYINNRLSLRTQASVTSPPSPPHPINALVAHSCALLTLENTHRKPCKPSTTAIFFLRPKHTHAHTRTHAHTHAHAHAHAHTHTHTHTACTPSRSFDEEEAERQARTHMRRERARLRPPSPLRRGQARLQAMAGCFLRLQLGLQRLALRLMRFLQRCQPRLLRLHIDGVARLGARVCMHGCAYACGSHMCTCVRVWVCMLVARLRARVCMHGCAHACGSHMCTCVRVWVCMLVARLRARVCVHGCAYACGAPACTCVHAWVCTCLWQPYVHERACATANLIHVRHVHERACATANLIHVRHVPVQVPFLFMPYCVSLLPFVPFCSICVLVHGPLG